jgi:uncharacterized protein DUF1572
MEEEFLDQSIKIFQAQKDLADKAIAQLSDEELYFQPDKESNSVAVIMKHLAGNMLSRWANFLTTDGEKPWRDRDSEFIISDHDAAALKEHWENGWLCLFNTLVPLTEGDLMETVTIRGEEHTVIQAILRQISHYGNHVGQIVYLAKHIKGTDWKTLSIPKGQSNNYRTIPFKP